MTKQVPTRLASFAVISAVEEDLRSLLRNLSAAVLDSNAREKALRRAKSVDSSAGEWTDSELLDYTDFADLASSLRVVGAEGPGDADLVAAADVVEAVSPARNRVCHARPLEPEDFITILEGAAKLIQRFGVPIMARSHSTRERLSTDPTFVFSYAIPDFWRDDEVKPSHNLPLPEFDDTGFLGRTKDRRDLLKHLLSPYPVVTVVGEGGIGKTALAMRCLYDLVELGEQQPYDYIIWVTLKTAALTTNGIVDIKNSITTVLGLFQNAAGAMGVPAATAKDQGELLFEILEYLKTFKVLLAIDNLETVDPGSLRPLLSELPQGSKLLLTSRVGLGEFEVRYPLSALTHNEAKGLMRRYAQTLNLQSLLKYPEPLLDRFVDTLFGNPLLIKWFVSGIMAGSSPDQILMGTQRTFEQALTFCFENLFERLDTTSRRLLHVIAAARRPLTRGQLLLVADVEPDVLDASLTMLHNSSMLRRQIVGELHAFSLTDIAEKYLTKVAPPPSDVLRDVAQRLREVRMLTEVNQVSRAAYKYEWSVIECDPRNVDQLIAASILRRAVDAQKRGAYVEAEELIKDAKNVVPTFSETYRIEAGLETIRRRIYPAEEAFRQAIELDPKSAKARYARANFLVEQNGDLETALGDIDVALSLDPGEATLETARARILTRLGKYSDARDLYDKLLRVLDDRPRRWRIPTRDQAAEAFRRSMEKDKEMNDEEALHGHFMTASRILLDAHRRRDWDDKTLARLQRVYSDASRYAYQWRSEKLARTVLSELRKFGEPVTDTLVASELSLQRIIQMWPSHWTEVKQGSAGETIALVDSATGDTDIEPGEIDTLLETYGFIQGRTGRRMFFHSSEVVPLDAWRRLRIGDRVTFRIGANLKGPVAKEVTVVQSQ